jgi:competence protein ComEA
MVNVNSASAEELDALSGIGKTRAAAIIRGRPYAGIEELVSRHILPTSAYDAIKDKIFVGRE